MYAATHLVIYLLRGIGKSDFLLEYVSHFLQLLAFRPVIEGSSNVHLAGWMSPVGKGGVSFVLSEKSYARALEGGTHHLKTKVPIAAVGLKVGDCCGVG